MTQENKELLIKDLSARLPYKLIVQIDNCGIWDLRGVDHDSAELRDMVIVWHGETYPLSKNSFPITKCKPYLFPLSSMTDEQKGFLIKNYKFTFDSCGDNITNGVYSSAFNRMIYHTINEEDLSNIIDWLNKNHFDYRGLIEKSLALDTTGLNIY